MPETKEMKLSIGEVGIKMRILVVEDERDLNSIICNKLVKEGYNVDACYDGMAALDYMEAEI